MNVFKRIVAIFAAFAIVMGVLYIINYSENKDAFSTATAQGAASELRGIWVATVFSLDFPQNTSTDSEQLKLELDRIVNNAKVMNFNAIFFQVRPACDAFYNSAIFPTSKYLTGTQGLAPNNSFDPLEYIVSKAHENGIQLHAWINPYRVTASANDEAELSSNNPAVQNPSLVIKHSDGKMYLNPALPEVRSLVVNGAVEIAQKYNVDGIHLDDYFYPSGGFDDYSYFQSMGGGYSNIDDWRRDNVTALIRELHSAIRAVNPEIAFGVSPAGIWANKNEMPEGSATSGSQTYSKQYADTRKWVKEEIVDYIAPQIYWTRDLATASFDVLSKWWNDTVDGTRVKLYIGLAAYKADSEEDVSSSWYSINGINELSAQIDICNNLKNIDGYIAYKYKSVIYNPQIYSMFKVKNTGGSLNLNNGTYIAPAKTEEPVATEIPKTEEPKPTEPEKPEQSSSGVFKDMSGYEWAENAVVDLVDKGVIKGMSDTEFMPFAKIRRADYTLMITRMFGESAKFSDNFADVTADKYYYEEIGAAKKLGFAQGMGDNLFYPEREISRQDMAVMAYRILKTRGVAEHKAENTVFGDFAEVADYAKDAVITLNYLGVLNGDTSGNVRPRDMASRADTAVFVNNIRKLIANK